MMHRSSASSLLIACWLSGSGCASSWHTVQASPSAAMAAHPRGDVRVTRTDGSMVTLHQPAVSGDSIVGYEDPPWDQGGNAKATRRAIPLGDARSVSVWERDGSANTVLWVIGASFGALMLLAIAAPNGGSGT
jgi:hypothetical protein